MNLRLRSSLQRNASNDWTRQAANDDQLADVELENQAAAVKAVLGDILQHAHHKWAHENFEVYMTPSDQTDEFAAVPSGASLHPRNHILVEGRKVFYVQFLHIHFPRTRRRSERHHEWVVKPGDYNYVGMETRRTLAAVLCCVHPYTVVSSHCMCMGCAVFVDPPLTAFKARDAVQGVRLEFIVIVILLPLVEGDSAMSQMVVHSIWCVPGRSLSFVDHHAVYINMSRLNHAERKYTRYFLLNVQRTHDTTYSAINSISDPEHFCRREEQFQKHEMNRKVKREADDPHFSELTERLQKFWPDFNFKHVTDDDIADAFADYTSDGDAARARELQAEGVPRLFSSPSEASSESDF